MPENPQNHLTPKVGSSDGLAGSFAKVAAVLAIAVAATLSLNFLVFFPYHLDIVTPPVIRKDSGDFYTKIYSKSVEASAEAPAKSESGGDNAGGYVSIAQRNVQLFHIKEDIAKFVDRFQLQDKHVLDVGAGTGYLQDMVEDYVGLDISASAGRYFHKPFVQASATEMPFRDGEFDVLWSIWVLEHVPKPEQALVEIRRVVKDGGILYLNPAWNCPPWIAQGYPVRPYSDLGMRGKLIKASLPLASPLRVASLLGVRYVRQQYARISSSPTRFHYNLLEPNYAHYWMSDSDALNDLDLNEALLWFTSRGDECLNCDNGALLQFDELIIRVHKRTGA
ncbi:MAG: methyltransferase domain-containing protein [Bryobacteraceae bacterium]